MAVAVIAAAAGAGTTALVRSGNTNLVPPYSIKKYGNVRAVRIDLLRVECIPQSLGLTRPYALHCYRLDDFPGSYNIAFTARDVVIVSRGSKRVFSAKQP